MGLFKHWLYEVMVDCPNGIFVKVLPTTDSIKPLTDHFGHWNLRPDLHCTAIYSKTPARSIDLPAVARDERYQAKGVELTWWEGHDKEGYLVLLLKSPALQRLHKRFTDVGIMATHADYKPHVTLINPCDAAPDDLAYQNAFLSEHPLTLDFLYGGYTILDPKS
jgi:hypothetical protein